jgi:hypothetical protein
MSEQANRFRDGVLSYEQVIARPLLSYLVKPWLVEHTVAALVGAYSVGKSFVALAWAWAVAWAGHPVLYVASEGADGLGPRLRALAQAHGGLWPEGFEVYPHPVDLLDEDQVNELTAYVVERGHPLVVIDTLNRSIGGRSENDPATMGNAYEAVDHVRRRSDRATVLVVHHPREDGAFRGYKNWVGNAQTVITASTKGGVLTLSTHPGDRGKQKDGRPAKQQLQLREVTILGADGKPLRTPEGDELTSCVVEPASIGALLDAAAKDFGKRLANREASLALLKERAAIGSAVTGKDAADFRTERKIAERTFTAMVSGLVSNGLVTKDGRGMAAEYRLRKE